LAKGMHPGNVCLNLKPDGGSPGQVCQNLPTVIRVADGAFAGGSQLCHLS
jgi:hypothetical protein